MNSLGNLLRHLRDEVIYLCLKPFGPAFSDRKFPAKLLLKQVIIQKILGINSGVPWPVHWTSQVKAPGKIERGTRCPGLGMGCYIDGRNGIEFGENVWIGPRVSIISVNHNLNDYGRYVEETSISIGDNCWLATGAIILPGVKLGNHVVVAAGAVVTKSFTEDNIVLAGAPATVVKRLEPYGDADGA
jgi:acetyltransferase-like isoleucine patch superfamily enzyme